MSSSHQKTIDEIVTKLTIRRDMYGSVLVNSFLRKDYSLLVNISTKITPLYHSDPVPVTEKLDYGNFVLLKTSISLDDLIGIIRKLPENASVELSFGDTKIEVNGRSLGNYYKFDSGMEFLDVDWGFEKYSYSLSSYSLNNEPLVNIDLPLFPDFRSCLREFVGIDVDHYSDAFGITFCLPNYSARIREMNISSTIIKVRVETKYEKIANIIGKLYCR